MHSGCELSRIRGRADAEVTKVEGRKTLETWLDRVSIEAVRVFVGRSHPFSFRLQNY